MSGISSTSTMKKPSVCVKRRTAARRLPSTSTFTVPSGRRSSWMIVPIVPIVKISSGIGSFVFALRCAERKISFPPAAPFPIASSSALIDFSRPTNSGTTMCGNTTMSRSGSSGTRRGPLFSSWRSDIRAQDLSNAAGRTPKNECGRALISDASRGHRDRRVDRPSVVVHVLRLLGLLHLDRDAVERAAGPLAPWVSMPGIGSVTVGAGPAASSAPSLTTISDHPPSTTAIVQNIIDPRNTSGSQATQWPRPPEPSGRLERGLQTYIGPSCLRSC